MTSTPRFRSTTFLDVPKPPDLSWHVQARQPINYEVVITRGLLTDGNGVLARACGSDGSARTRCLVVIDETVAGLYGDALAAYLAAWKIEGVWKLVPGNEDAKTLEQAVEVTEAMTEMGILRRTEKVLAVGGGVVMDIAGLAASLYRRGAPYVRIPTTLMGQIDAGIGVKTGINHGNHKNRLGTYCAPEAALIDPAFLSTQDRRHVANGVAEMIKMALVKDAVLFDLLEQWVPKLETESLASCGPDAGELLSRAIAGMLDELEPNLWEGELERAVDYGHTFSPSLELHADPPMLHGEAVAVDMAVSLALAHNRRMLSLVDTERALKLMRCAGLPLSHPTFTVDLLEQALEETIKHRDGLQRVPLTHGIGSVQFVNDVTSDELTGALAFVAKRVFADLFASLPGRAGWLGDPGVRRARRSRAGRRVNAPADIGEVSVFDVGGTYLRSAQWSKPSGLGAVRRRASPSRRSHPDATPAQLQARLIEAIAAVPPPRSAADGATRLAGIAFGAALDHHSGTVYASAPLWGEHTAPFDLVGALNQARPDVGWTVVNDVTAVLLHVVAGPQRQHDRKTMLLTVSTGIACRILDHRRGEIAVDDCGLQGEIGHLPARAELAGAPVALRCDCGAADHVAAFASGPGIERMAKALQRRTGADWRHSELGARRGAGEALGPALRCALDSGDELAWHLLEAVTAPVADVLRTAVCLDPELDHVGVAGGVAFGLGAHYRTALLGHLTRGGIYLTSELRPGWLADRLVLHSEAQANGLVGAGLAALASASAHVTPAETSAGGGEPRGWRVRPPADAARSLSTGSHA